MSSEVIVAVGSLWKLGAVLLLGLVVILFRGQIASLLSRTTSLRFRRGDTEVAVTQDTEPGESSQPGIAAADLADSVETTKNSRQSSNIEVSENGNLRFKLVDAFFDKKFDEAESIYRSLLDAEPNAVERLRNEAMYYALRYMHAGDTKALESLKGMTENRDIRPKVFSWIGYCHEQSDRLDDAIAAFEDAVSSSQNEEERAGYIGSLALCLLKVGEMSDAVHRLTQALQITKSDEALGILYDQIAAIEKERGNKRNVALAYEMVAFHRPQSTSARFSAAYAQADAALDHLSTTNYTTLLRFAPEHPLALNNLGVALSRLGLPIRATESYQKSADKGNTLAQANLAYSLLEAGFAKEAEELINSALKVADPHENVGRAMADIAARRQDEDKNMQRISQRGIQQQRFFHSFYPISLMSKPIQAFPQGHWFVGSVPAQVTLEGNKLVVEWGSGPDKRQVEGDFLNHAGSVVIRKWEKMLFSDQWHFGSGTKAYAFFDDDISRLTILSTEGEDNLYTEVVRG